MKPINLANAALLIIDLQRDLVMNTDGNPHAWAEAGLHGANQALTWARELSVPVVWVRVERRADYADVARKGSGPPRFVAGTMGAQVAPPLSIAPEDFDVTKPRVSPFYGTRLETTLRQLHATTLLVCGAYTYLAVEALVREAYDRDMSTLVLRDGCAAPNRELHEHAMTKVLPILGRVVGLDDLPNSR